MRKRFFNPYVGSEYKNGLFGSKKVLVLGASHYCTYNDKSEVFNCPVWEECTSMLKKDSSKFNNCCPYYENIGWIREYGIKLEDSASTEIENFFDSPSQYKTYDNFTKFISDYFGLTDVKELWSRLAFVNYVQYFLPTVNTPKLNKDDIVNFEAFLEILDELQPDIIIAWGSKITNHFKLDKIQGMVEWLHKRDNDYFWDLIYNEKKYIIINSWHPSDPYRWKGGQDDFYSALKAVL